MEKPYCVVSVEDDLALFKLIAVTLRTLPIKLYHAPTGQEALDLVDKLDVDLVILDINLPDIHGWDVLKKIHEMETVQLKGVIVLTAHTAPTHRVIAHLQDDVTAYISKPFNPMDLRGKVSKTLGIKSEQQPE